MSRSIEVGPCPVHRVAVGRRAPPSNVGRHGRALTPVDDRRLVAAGSISRAAADAGRPVRRRAVRSADLEDRVGVEAVERPQLDQRVVALAPERPVVGAAASVPSSHVAVVRRPRPSRPLAAASRRRCSARADESRRRRPRSPRRALAGRLADSISSSCQRGPAGRSPASGPGRGTPAPPRAARRSRRAARRAARSRGRIAGTARRRSRRARAIVAPRRGRPRCRRSLRRTLWISRSRSNRAARREAGRVDRLDRREVRPSAASSPRTASRHHRRAGRPGRGCRVRREQPGCRGSAPEARLDQVVEAARRAARGPAPVGAAVQASVSRGCGHGPPSWIRLLGYKPDGMARGFVRPARRLARLFRRSVSYRRAPRASPGSRLSISFAATSLCVRHGLPWAYSTTGHSALGGLPAGRTEPSSWQPSERERPDGGICPRSGPGRRTPRRRGFRYRHGDPGDARGARRYETTVEQPAIAAPA